MSDKEGDGGKKSPGIDAKKKKKSIRKKLMSYILNLLVLAAACSVVYFYEPDINKPLPYPRIHSRYTLSNDTLFQEVWGTYRPWVYFGIGTKITREFFFDLMWFQQEEGKPRLRYSCDDRDQLITYRWTEHEGGNYATQLIRDGNLNITTQFLKGPTEEGATWSVRVKGESHVASESYSFIFVGFGGYGSGKRELLIAKPSNQFMIRGRQIYINKYQLYNSPPISQHKVKLHYLAHQRIPPSKLKETVLSNLKRRGSDKTYSLPDRNFTSTHRLDVLGIGATQFTFKTPFEIDIHFVPSQFELATPPSGVAFSSEELTQKLSAHSSQFQDRFERTFGLTGRGYSPEEVAFGQVALSSLLGGIGFFFGRGLVSAPHHEGGYIEYMQARLVTGTPARAKFPRGFLWDEGFHLLLVAHWSPSLAIDILGHWLDLINADGWIPREQVLGRESTDRVPAEFVVQHNDVANPPTFFLVLESLFRLEKTGRLDTAEFRGFLESAYPRLRAWYDWYQRTQKGSVSNTYYWRGRNGNIDTELNPKTLASGLDDSPRASHPSDTERHVDLLCWMTLATRVMSQVAHTVGEEEDRSRYFKMNMKLGLNHLVKHHWDPGNKRFSDFGLHSSDVTLSNKGSTSPQGETTPPRRKVGSKPKEQLVPHFGYINMFPLLLQLLPADCEQLGHILTSLNDTNLLWTDFGLRSLSASDKIYRKPNTPSDAPYWRGAVWINLNFLAVQALHHYAGVEGPYRKTAGLLYSSLRENLVSNVFKQYQETGYFWEQYDDTTGRGTGAHPFNGWSSLVLLMMGEKY